MFTFWILIITGIILLVFWLIRRVSYPGKDLYYVDKAIEILKERYARGEINREDFERMKKNLS
ncbi:MAG: SHOCT domain-containing protein [Candidatus Nealsonbacteria bacterium]|nr:MAG: SHOCT domain-containing protein [Candidatus Nealsonbacteria bacterium]